MVRKQAPESSFLLVVCFVTFMSVLSEGQKGICKTGRFPCCAGYYLNQLSDTCEDCPHGTFGENCQHNCVPNYFGLRCLDRCICTKSETCDRIRGCVKNATECPAHMYITSCSKECTTKLNDEKCKRICKCSPDGICDNAMRCFPVEKEKIKIPFVIAIVFGVIILVLVTSIIIKMKCGTQRENSNSDITLNELFVRAISSAYTDDETVMRRHPLTVNKCAKKLFGTGHLSVNYRGGIMSEVYADIDETKMCRKVVSSQNDIDGMNTEDGTNSTNKSTCDHRGGVLSGLYADIDDFAMVSQTDNNQKLTDGKCVRKFDTEATLSGLVDDSRVRVLSGAYADIDETLMVKEQGCNEFSDGTCTKAPYSVADSSLAPPAGFVSDFHDRVLSRACVYKDQMGICSFESTRSGKSNLQGVGWYTNEHFMQEKLEKFSSGGLRKQKDNNLECGVHSSEMTEYSAENQLASNIETSCDDGKTDIYLDVIHSNLYEDVTSGMAEAGNVYNMLQVSSSHDENCDEHHALHEPGIHRHPRTSYLYSKVVKTKKTSK